MNQWREGESESGGEWRVRNGKSERKERGARGMYQAVMWVKLGAANTREEENGAWRVRSGKGEREKSVRRRHYDTRDIDNRDL